MFPNHIKWCVTLICNGSNSLRFSPGDIFVEETEYIQKKPLLIYVLVSTLNLFTPIYLKHQKEWVRLMIFFLQEDLHNAQLLQTKFMCCFYLKCTVGL